MFALVRHGERSDVRFAELHNVTNKSDPQLTKLGEKESHKTGEFLAELIEKKFSHIKSIKIISSPFLRCIQTAEIIKKCLMARFDIPIIFCEDSCGEWYSTNLYSAEEYKNLELFQAKASNPKTLPLISTPLAHNTFFERKELPKFYEHSDLQTSYKRIEEFFLAANNYLYNNLDQAIICSSHAFAVNGLLKYYFRTHVDFCSTTICVPSAHNLQIQQPYVNYLEHIFSKPKL